MPRRTLALSPLGPFGTFDEEGKKVGTEGSPYPRHAKTNPSVLRNEAVIGPDRFFQPVGGGVEIVGANGDLKQSIAPGELVQEPGNDRMFCRGLENREHFDELAVADGNDHVSRSGPGVVAAG